MLSDRLLKVKTWVISNRQDLAIAVLIFLVGLASFGLGRLSMMWQKKEPITITNQEASIVNYGTARNIEDIVRNPYSSPVIPSSRGKYVASKNGTAYHYPWCAGAQRIKESNKILFDTKEAAEKAGYKPAGNCEGL